MRMISSVLMLTLLVLLGSCTDQSIPTAPQDDVLMDQSLSKRVEKTTFRVTYPQEFTSYADCLGDEVDYHGTADAVFTTWTTPSGNEHYVWYTDYVNTPNRMHFYEQQSGIRWDQFNAFNVGTHEMIKSNGPLWIAHSQGNEWYRSENGDELRVFYKWTFKLDTDGNVIRDSFIERYHCQ